MVPYRTKSDNNKKALLTSPSEDDLIALLHAPNKAEVELVRKAYRFARTTHGGQMRYSGEPYFDHVAITAKYIAQLGMSAHTVAAGLLHDTVEDRDISLDEIEKEFNLEIRQLVEGVTKLGTVRYRGMQRHAESLRKLFAATSQDVRVMIIKLMDRLHNARTLEYVPEHKRGRIALETLEIYAPIAYRLGMNTTAHDLEDAAFPFAYPEEYKQVYPVFQEAGGEDIEKLDKIANTIKKKIAEYGISNFRTEKRIKSLYSFYRKLLRKEKDINKIMDMWAVRIIVPTISDCYTILGIIHAEWRPLPGRIKDFIAFPKPNGYKSIHTTIHINEGLILEVQIRTEEMHRAAQYGIASHFAYKENSSANSSSGLSWLRQFFPLPVRTNSNSKVDLLGRSSDPIYTGNTAPEWVKHLASLTKNGRADTFLNEIKNDFFSYRIFAFTPTGDVIDLPINATVIDFAYAIHSDVGEHMSGAKINGKLEAITSTLRNGDIVEIMTNPKSRPTRKWLDAAKTTMARKHIHTFLTKDRESANA